VTIRAKAASVEPIVPAAIEAELESTRRQLIELRTINRNLTRELEHWRGRRLRTGPAVPLAEAARRWLDTYRGRDPDHMRTVRYEIQRFVRDFTTPNSPRRHGEQTRQPQMHADEHGYETDSKGATGLGSLRPVPVNPFAFLFRSCLFRCRYPCSSVSICGFKF
jgi:hypothetical protein